MALNFKNKLMFYQKNIAQKNHFFYHPDFNSTEFNKEFDHLINIGNPQKPNNYNKVVCYQWNSQVKPNNRSTHNTRGKTVEIAETYLGNLRNNTDPADVANLIIKVTSGDKTPNGKIDQSVIAFALLGYHSDHLYIHLICGPGYGRRMFDEIHSFAKHMGLLYVKLSGLPGPLMTYRLKYNYRFIHPITFEPEPPILTKYINTYENLKNLESIQKIQLSQKPQMCTPGNVSKTKTMIETTLKQLMKHLQKIHFTDYKTLAQSKGNGFPMIYAIEASPDRVMNFVNGSNASESNTNQSNANALEKETNSLINTTASSCSKRPGAVTRSMTRYSRIHVT